MYRKNPCFTFEEIVRVAYRALNKKIDIKLEDQLIYIINYLMDYYWENDFIEFLKNDAILDISSI